MRILMSFLLAILLAVPGILAQSKKANDEVWPQLMPPGEGREMVLDSCGSCHNLKVVVHGRMTAEGWTKTVNDMIQRGAPVFLEEIEPMTAYLSKAFGTNVPRLLNVNTATREELEKLPNVTPEIASRILEARSKGGTFKNSEDLRRALGVENTEFEKIVYLLKYSN